MLTARRPFTFFAADLRKGDPVVGSQGQEPDGRMRKRLVDAGFAYETNGSAPPAEKAPAKPRARKGGGRTTPRKQSG